MERFIQEHAEEIKALLESSLKNIKELLNDLSGSN